VPVVRDTAGTAMGETISETGPAIDLQQKIGDLDPWQPVIGRPSLILDDRGSNRLQRRNHEAVPVKAHLRQFSLPGKGGYLRQCGIQRYVTLRQKCVSRPVDRKG